MYCGHQCGGISFVLYGFKELVRERRCVRGMDRGRGVREAQTGTIHYCCKGFRVRFLVSSFAFFPFPIAYRSMRLQQYKETVSPHLCRLRKKTHFCRVSTTVESIITCHFVNVLLIPRRYRTARHRCSKFLCIYSIPITSLSAPILI